MVSLLDQQQCIVSQFKFIQFTHPSIQHTHSIELYIINHGMHTNQLTKASEILIRKS